MNAQRDGGGRRIGGGGIRWWVFIIAAAYAGYYYFSNRTVDPTTGEKVLIDKNLSVDEEKALGLQAYEQILAQERPLDPNAEVAQQIREVAQRLIAKVEPVEATLAAENNLQPQHISRGFEWDVQVIESDQVNAFCLPGGKMAVYTGLVPVAENADAMAAVMGHEMAHAILRHGAQRMAQQKLAQVGQVAGALSGMDPGQQQMVMAAMGYGMLMPYARKHENEADEVGLLLAAAACYDPREAIPLWERMGAQAQGHKPPEFMSTHPSGATRIANLQALMPKALEMRERSGCPPLDAAPPSG